MCYILKSMNYWRVSNKYDYIQYKHLQDKLNNYSCCNLIYLFLFIIFFNYININNNNNNNNNFYYEFN